MTLIVLNQSTKLGHMPFSGTSSATVHVI